MDLRIPRLRRGSYFPGFLEPRRMAEKALTGFVTFIAARAKRGRIGLYAAAISRHVANAFDRSSRKVQREVRWRWTLKWL